MDRVSFFLFNVVCCMLPVVTGQPSQPYTNCPEGINHPIYLSDAVDPCTYWLCIGTKAYAYPCGDRSNNGVKPFWTGTADPCTLPNMHCKTVLEIQKKKKMVSPISKRPKASRKRQFSKSLRGRRRRPLRGRPRITGYFRGEKPFQLDREEQPSRYIIQDMNPTSKQTEDRNRNQNTQENRKIEKQRIDNYLRQVQNQERAAYQQNSGFPQENTTPYTEIADQQVAKKRHSPDRTSLQNLFTESPSVQQLSQKADTNSPNTRQLSSSSFSPMKDLFTESPIPQQLLQLFTTPKTLTTKSQPNSITKEPAGAVVKAPPAPSPIRAPPSVYEGVVTYSPPVRQSAIVPQAIQQTLETTPKQTASDKPSNFGTKSRVPTSPIMVDTNTPAQLLRTSIGAKNLDKASKLINTPPTVTNVNVPTPIQYVSTTPTEHKSHRDLLGYIGSPDVYKYFSGAEGIPSYVKMLQNTVNGKYEQKPHKQPVEMIAPAYANGIHLYPSPMGAFKSMGYRGPTLLPSKWLAYPGYSVLGAANGEAADSGDICIQRCLSRGPSVCAAVDYDSKEGACWFHGVDTACGRIKISLHIYHVKINQCPAPYLKPPVVVP